MRIESPTLPNTLARIEHNAHTNIVRSKVATRLCSITCGLVGARCLVDGAVGDGLVGAVIRRSVIQGHGLVGTAGGACWLNCRTISNVDVGCACKSALVTKYKSGSKEEETYK